MDVNKRAEMEKAVREVANKFGGRASFGQWDKRDKETDEVYIHMLRASITFVLED